MVDPAARNNFFDVVFSGDETYRAAHVRVSRKKSKAPTEKALIGQSDATPRRWHCSFQRFLSAGMLREGCNIMFLRLPAHRALITHPKTVLKGSNQSPITDEYPHGPGMNIYIYIPKQRMELRRVLVEGPHNTGKT